MQICWRRVAFRETDHELLWLSVSLASLGAAAAWFALHLPWPRCMFQTLTGHPCVTCGATRSALQFFHGHFFNALQWNPLAFVGLCAVSIFDFYALIVLATRAPRLRIAYITSIEKNFVRILLVALLALNWIYLLVANPGF
jgi:hypothetical protein